MKVTESEVVSYEPKMVLKLTLTVCKDPSKQKDRLSESLAKNLDISEEKAVEIAETVLTDDAPITVWDNTMEEYFIKKEKDRPFVVRIFHAVYGKGERTA